jgi:hypothetical protein
MPRSLNERQSLEEERAEIPGQIAKLQTELDATLLGAKSQRQFLIWRIRERRLRLAKVEKRLAAMRAGG